MTPSTARADSDKPSKCSEAVVYNNNDREIEVVVEIKTVSPSQVTLGSRAMQLDDPNRCPLEIAFSVV